MADNGLQIQNTPNIIIITDSDQNSVTVTQPVTNVITVNTIGPQGAVGPQGPSGSLLPSQSGSFSITGSLTVSGSGTFTNIGPAIFSGSTIFTQGGVTGSFTGSFKGDGSQLTGIVSSKWTGSNPISRNSDVEITGSLTVTNVLTASAAIITGNVQVLGTASINTLVVNQTQLSTGSNQLGDAANDFQTLYGTVTIPTGSLTVTGSTFISSSAQTQLQVGSNLLFVSSSGQVGIGTITPSSSISLDVNGASRFNGNLFINPTGSTTSNPITIGASSFSTGNAVRFQFGDALNSWQNSYGGRQTIQSYWGIEIYGSRQSLTPLGFTNGNATDAAVLIGGTVTGNAVLRLIGASGQTGNLQEWRNTSNILSAVTSTGSLLLGTSTDSGFKLDVSGSGRFTNNLTVTGSTLITGSQTLVGTLALTGSVIGAGNTSNYTVFATSSLAASKVISSTLSASANNDVLVGLDINPTFTNGAFTGVSNYYLRASGNVQLGKIYAIGINGNQSSGQVVAPGGGTAQFVLTSEANNGFIKEFIMAGRFRITTEYFGSGATYFKDNNGTIPLTLFTNSSNNVGVGTTTDAGFKLDVSGSGRFSGNLTITGSASNSLLVKGSGATSGTYTLLIQNSSGANGLIVRDDGVTITNEIRPSFIFVNGVFVTGGGNRSVFGIAPGDNSAELTINSTTRGFLPPRTNLTSNISNPAQGLQTYLTGSTNEGLYYYNSGSYQAWTRVLNDSGSQNITGNLNVTGSVAITASASTSSAALLVYKSGSTVVSVQGSQGSLMSVEDSLTGSLMSVGNISGLPLMEVFDDGTMNMGKFNVYPIKIVSTGSLAVITGSFSGSLTGTAATASYVNPLVQNVTITGNITASGAISASGQINAGYFYGTNGGWFRGSQFTEAGNIHYLTVGYGPSGQFQLQTANGAYAVLRATDTGLVGIGTTTPTAKLHVLGSGTTSATTSLLVQNANTSASLTVLDNGSVGINGTNTNYKLAVTNNDAVYAPTLFVNNATGSYINTLDQLAPNLTTGQSAAFTLGVTSSLNNTVGFNFYYTGSGSTLNAATFTFWGGSPLLWLRANGNLQLGTNTDAGYKLDVNGSTRITGVLYPGSINVGGSTIAQSGYNLNITPFTSAGVVRMDLQNGRTVLFDGWNNNSNLNLFTTLYNYYPTAGTYTNNLFYLNPTINETGTAAGTFRGIYYAPTLTSLKSTHIAFESTAGKIIVGGPVSASSALAQGVYFNNTLIASASNDTLVGLDINPTFNTGSFTGVNKLALRTSGNTYLSGSTGTSPALTVYKSGSTVMSIQGSQGELFSITDSLSGSLFSVSNVSGLPIVEVFSDNTTLIGNYQAPALITTQIVTANSGSTVIYSIPTSSYDGAFFDYTIKSGSTARVGSIISTWMSTTASFTEISASSIGDTSGFLFGVIVSGSNMVLTGSVSTSGWAVKTIIRSI